MDRRHALIGLAAWGGFSAWATPALAAQARQGGVLLIRHASTEAGLGDPPGFTLGQCRTQRNLSAQGRAEAQAIGEWFRRHGLQAHAVRSSQWCRCQETARLAFGQQQDWPPLNSTFDGQGQPVQQLRALRDRLQQLPPGRLEVWVTHQVIMTALTEAYPAMGEGFLIDDLGMLRARGMMRADA
jgi:broad specificity phosphatase PhoE